MDNFVFLAIPNGWSIALIVIVALLLFGGKKVPELMKGIGQGVKELKNALKEGAKEDEDDTSTPKETKTKA